MVEQESQRKLLEILELSDILKDFESIEKIGPVAIRLIGSRIHFLTGTILRDFPKPPEGNK